MLKNFLPKEEIVVNSFEDVMKIVEILLRNHNVAMVSTEEEFYVVNWIYTSEVAASRNDVVFVSRDEYEYSTLDSEDE